MSGFWAPYQSMQDAAARIGRFADKAVGPACGISFSDGQSVAVLRQARPDGRGRSQWMNVLRYHVSGPATPAKPPPATGFLARAEAFFWSVMEAEGKAEIANAQAQMAMSNAVVGAVRDNVWEPAHKFLLRHKLVADGVGVAIDVIGVVAGVAFVVAFAPEIGVVAAVTGFAAAGGSVLLAVADGTVFGFELAGDKETAEKIEGMRVTQWARIVGAVMTLVDIPVGGIRSLVEVRALKVESGEAIAAAARSDEAAAAARARMEKIANPAKHPGPVARRAHKAKQLAAQAEEHRREAEKLARSMHITSWRDSGAAFGATPAGTALITAAPPAMLLNQAQKSADDSYLKSLEPEGGLPPDTKLEIRMSGVQKVAH